MIRTNTSQQVCGGTADARWDGKRLLLETKPLPLNLDPFDDTVLRLRQRPAARPRGALPPHLRGCRRACWTASLTFTLLIQ